nr:DUF58 domain-containing protein [uncultured Desulfobacter sp.]
MIPAHIIKKIKQIHIKSRKTVNTLMAGQYRSVFKGSGIEFEEVREYAPGDDVKAIDWNVSARTGKVFVKLFREERESIVMLLIDMSASLNFGTHSGSKLEKVAELASVLAFNAIKNNDKVGVIFFTDQVEKYIPPKKGSAHIWRVIKEIFTFEPKGVGTDIACVLDFMAKISKKRSFAFVISDYLSPEYEKSLRLLNRRHEVVGLRVFDDGSFHLPLAGIVRVKDFETGEETLMDAGSKKMRQWYTDQRQKIHTLTESVFSKARVDLVDVTTADSVSDVLTRYFMLRESRR